MHIAIQIPARIWHQTSAYVLQDNVERHAFIYCESSGDSENMLLRAVDLKVPSDGDYEKASAMDVVLKREYVIQCLEKARRLQMSIVDVHSHPFEREGRFSHVDYKYGSEAADWVTRKIAEGAFPYIFWGMIVVGRRSSNGLVWNHESRKFQEFSDIVVQDAHKRKEATKEVRGKSWMDFVRPKVPPEQTTARAYGQSHNQLVSMRNVPLSKISPYFHPATVPLYALSTRPVNPSGASEQAGTQRIVARDSTIGEKLFPCGLIEKRIDFGNRWLDCQAAFHVNCRCALPIARESVPKNFCVIDLTKFLGNRTTDAKGIEIATIQYFKTIAKGGGGFECHM